MPRESSKCREWEKERRNRLNEGFTSLSKLLPCYDPSLNISKIDILRNAAAYIEELQTKIKDLISENNIEAAKKLESEEFKKLQERIKRLLCKNEQLCTLLRDAKISIPKGCSVVKKFKYPFCWSNKILPEQAKILQKKELDKENNASAKKIQARKFTNKNRNKVGGQNSTPKHRKAILNRSDPKKNRSPKKKKVKPLSPSKCVIVLSQPSVTQPCYVITNAPSNNIVGGTSTVITNSGLVTNPLVSSKASKSVASISPLGPGTLILANGTIMPVLQQQTVLPLASQIITRPPIILLPRNSVSVPSTTTSTTSTKIVSSGVKTLARIKPKYCLTKTTQVNKVPIPALTSRYSNPEVVLKKAEPKPVKTKPVEKKIVSKETEKKVEDAETGEKRKAAPPEDNLETKKAKVVEEEKEQSGKEPEKVSNETSNEKEKEEEKTSKEVKETKAEEVPPKKKAEEALDLNINHSELSNDIFASLQVPAGCQNPESTSPTAAFLLAFPLVSSLTGVKVTEVTEEDNTESQRGTPTLLQIGTMDNTKPTQSESLTPSLLNLDNLSFFSSKDISGFYNSFESNIVTTSTTSVVSTVSTVTKQPPKEENLQQKKINYQPPQPRQQPQPQPPQQQHPPQLPQRQPEKAQLVPCFENQNFVAITTNSTNSITQLNYQPKHNTGVSLETKQQASCANYTPQKSFPCNNFSEPPKISTTCSFANPIKSYPEPLYTNSSTYSYSNSSELNFNQNYYKDTSKSDTNRSYYLNYENYTDHRKNDASNTYFTSNYHSSTGTNKFSGTNTQKSKNSIQRPPINWMTTPDNRLQAPSDYVLPQFTKETEFYPTNTPTTYFNTNPMYPNEVTTNQETRKGLDLPLVPPVNTYQRNEVEENQFSWSPTKIPQFLDPPHNFVSSTLPTLVGDLALGNPLTFNEKGDKCQKKDTRRLKNYESNNNQGNFLSVSQLVDHNKEIVPARTTVRRNSGNRSSAKKVPQKSGPRKETKEVGYPNKVENSSGKGMKQLGYSSATKNSYSAEALIGHQMQTDGTQKNRQQNYSSNKPISVSSFLHDNILPYFPTVDLPQDNSYIQQNQNYQSSSFSHNFPSTFQNNTYTANSFIPSTTITSNYNFMHDVTHDYSENLNLFPPVNKDKNCNKNANRNVKEQQCAVTPKKSKRKPSNDLPGFVDFPFLSMPGSINSPILPDDFHTHTGFLQPPTPQLYPCKNPFTKPNDLTSASLLPLPPVPVSRSNIQHPEISPSINSAGTSLTNFNLSTIFPEINNKSVLPDPYSEPRIKDHSRSYSSTVQVSFSDKPTFSFSYINSTTPQSYNNQ